MRFKKIAKIVVLGLTLALLLHIVAPVSLRAQQRSCGAALDACLQVAAVVGFIYTVFCFEGYLFCKKYLER